MADLTVSWTRPMCNSSPLWHASFSTTSGTRQLRHRRWSLSLLVHLSRATSIFRHITMSQLTGAQVSRPRLRRLCNLVQAVSEHLDGRRS